jgi:PAS domain S-box-containing protein
MIHPESWAYAGHLLLLSRWRLALNMMDYMPQMVWATGPDGQISYYNAQWHAFTGTERGQPIADWSEYIHEEDRASAWQGWTECRESGQPYEGEYRLRDTSGHYRWVLARALPVHDEDGSLIRWIGTFTDIDENKRLEQQLQLFSRELNHRIKNVFTVVASMVALSARKHPEAADYVTKLSRRLEALGHAHDLAHPGIYCGLQPAETGEAWLHDLLARVLAPHPAYENGSISFSGEDVRIGERALAVLSLLLHELTTNALKHGALAADGRVRLFSQVRDGRLHLVWQETGGPPVSGAPAETGFGSQMADLSVRRQLGGTLVCRWLSTGLELEAVLPISKLR